MIQKIINTIIGLLTVLSGFFLLVTFILHFNILFAVDSSFFGILKFIFVFCVSYFLGIIVLGGAFHINMINETEERDYFENLKFISFCIIGIIIPNYLKWEFLIKNL